MFFLLPYGNDRRTSRVPVVTYALIAANVLMFLWLLPLDRRLVIETFGLVPAHPSIRNMILSLFVHAGFLHLLWNMLFLWLFGPNVEDALGRIEYAIFYLGSGIAAGLLHAVMEYGSPAGANIPVIGASGAIAGILGIFAIRFYKTRIKVFWYVGILVYPLRWGTIMIPAILGLGVWFARQLVGGFGALTDQSAGGTAYWAHIGGMVFGMALASAMRMLSEGSKEYLMTDARTSMQRGTTWDAAQNLRKLVERDPNNAEAHSELAKAYAMQDNRDGAVSHFCRAIELCLAKDDKKTAAACFTEMTRHFRDADLELRSSFRLALYFMEIACYDPALRLFQRIFFEHPGTSEAEVSLMKSGDLLLDCMEDPRRAVWCYERFLCEYPDSTYRAMVEKSLAECRKRIG